MIPKKIRRSLSTETSHEASHHLKESMEIQARKFTTQKFSEVLQKKLMDRFGRMPSANQIANQFNLRANGTEAITQETVRRWIKGLSLPQMDRFQVLSAWLGIRASEFLELQGKTNKEDVLTEERKLENHLLSIYRSLNPSEQHALNITAQALMEARSRSLQKEKS
jgi:transcriptional regulator with XRE-family HTH domain